MCQVCDAAEACRNVHADARWRAAAGAACADLAAFLADVNQHAGLYGRLRLAMARYEASRGGGGSRSSSSSGSDSGGGDGSSGGGSDAGAAPPLSPAQLAAFDAETALVGARLKADHERSGVHLTDPNARAALRRLMARGQHYAAEFNAALVRVGGGGRVMPAAESLRLVFLCVQFTAVFCMRFLVCDECS